MHASFLNSENYLAYFGIELFNFSIFNWYKFLKNQKKSSIHCTFLKFTPYNVDLIYLQCLTFRFFIHPFKFPQLKFSFWIYITARRREKPAGPMFNYYQSRCFCIWLNLIYSLSGLRCFLLKRFRCFFRFAPLWRLHSTFDKQKQHKLPFNRFSSAKTKTVQLVQIPLAIFSPTKMICEFKKKICAQK